MAELGKEKAEERILAYYAPYLRTAPMEKIGTVGDIRLHYMRNASTADYAKILLHYEWVWLQSHHGFVISDVRSCRSTWRPAGGSTASNWKGWKSRCPSRSTCAFAFSSSRRRRRRTFTRSAGKKLGG